MKTEKSSALRSRPSRASILIIVLVTLMMTAAMVALFVDKASTDLIVEARQIQASDLRSEAYSALEVTMSVLQAFTSAGNNVLRSPREGWGDPLAFAGWTPADGHTVDVSFEDESGKISLPTVTAANLTALFVAWEMSDADAAKLTDALMSWTKTNYTPTSAFTPTYDQRDIPYAPPGRSLLSFNELAAIDVAAETFYDEEGLPNELWQKFSNTFSLYNYATPNINALPVRPDVLSAVGMFDASVAEKLNEYLTGTGAYESNGPGYFKTANEIAAVTGAGSTRNFGIQISALRIHVTVHEGTNTYAMSALIALPNGATTVQSSATSDPLAAPTAGVGVGGAAGAAGAAAPGRGGAAPGAARGAVPTTPGARGAGGNPGAAGGVTGTATLQYPFTVLEIRENTEPASEPLPPPPEE